MLKVNISVAEEEEILGVGFTKEELDALIDDPFFSEDPTQVVPEDVVYEVSEGFRSDTLTKVVDEFHKRETVGISKYGTTVDRSDLDLSQWLQHLKEELMDATLYVQRTIDLVNNRGLV